MTNNKSASEKEPFVSDENSVFMPKGFAQMTLSDRLVVFHCNEGHLVNPGPIVSPDVASAYLPCTGRVDLATILSCFRKGALGVLLSGCPEGACRFPHPNGQCSADVLVSRAKRVIYLAGWDPRRVSFFSRGLLRGCGCSEDEDGEGSSFLERSLKDKIKELKDLGVQPLSLGSSESQEETLNSNEHDMENGGGEQSGEQDSDGRNCGNSGEHHKGEIVSDERHGGELHRDGLDSVLGLEGGERNGKVPSLVEERREADGMAKKIEDTRSGGEQ